MAYLLSNIARKLVLASLAAGVLLMSGCAGTKAAKKDTLGVKEEDLEKKEAAAKVFKEGADLLFVDNQQAVSKFDRASEIDPSLIAAYFNAGVGLEALGNLPEAQKRYEACLVVNKSESSCLENLLLVKAKSGDTEGANALALSYLTEFPQTPFALVAAAKLAFFKKDYVTAEKLAREAIEREAENIEALFVMARIFYERKEYAAAKWVLKNALELAPSHGGLHLTLGHTEMALGLLHDALDSYALAVEYLPTEEALESYGLLLLKRGRVTEALPVLKRLVELRPLDARGHMHLGNAYMANKMFDEAKASYLRVFEINPEEKDVNFNLGLLFYDLKPKEVKELDRLKTARDYFKAYVDKGGIPKDRLTEVNDYLKILNQKIEMEEYAAQSAKEAEEELGKEPEPEEEPATSAPAQEKLEIEEGAQEEESKETPPPPAAKEKPALKKEEEILQEIEEEKPALPEEKPVKEEKPAPEEKKKPKRPAQEFDEEEEDFFEDF